MSWVAVLPGFSRLGRNSCRFLLLLLHWKQDALLVGILSLLPQAAAS